MPEYFDKLSDFVNSETGEPKSGCKETVEIFKAALKSIQPAIKDQTFDLGEVLVMINRNFGLSWETIPWGKMDEIKTWLKNNYFRKLQIIAPEIHSRLMELENSVGAREYQDWFNKHDNQTKYARQENE